MKFAEIIGRAFNLENVESIDGVETSFAAEWAQHGQAWVLFGSLALAALALTFYLRYQTRGRRSLRIALGVARAAVLVLLLLVLAEPVLQIRFASNPRPLLYVLFDGTDSMNIKDEMSDAQRAEIAKSLDLAPNPDATSPGNASTNPNSPGIQEANKLSRADYVRAIIDRDVKENVLNRLSEKYRLKAFRFDQPNRGVSEVRLSNTADGKVDAAYVDKQLTTDGQVTALGEAFNDLATRHAARNLGGVVVFSDFAWNTGLPPVGLQQSPVKKLGVPVFTVGIGPSAAVDLGVDLQAPPLMKKGERSSVGVTLRQSGLDGQRASIRLLSRRMSGGDAAALEEMTLVAQREVDLTGGATSTDIPFTPAETGRFEFRAEVAPLEGEIVDQNNFATREINIRDDFLRLMFVEYEPTWEWRFIKEVFHRDKLVGMRGFRTFLRSADPKVRQTNELFLPTMTPQRSDFFANDVIFLGDMPSNTVSPRFCELTKEFVSKFGGGLVIVAGPRFGPSQLAETALADMLPVIAEGGSKIRDQREFGLQLTPAAMQYDFMRLGSDVNESENAKAWSNMGKLPWYQPVSRVHPLATVLAEHPTDKCSDGKTSQPLVAVRRYGRGEVIYIAFNETWRLRRKYGETYYRQFWGQMIHRLGLSHALGAQKRFVVRTDQPQYKEDEKVILTVEAYDANFEPLTEDKLPEGRLVAELVSPGRGGGPGDTRTISVPPLQPADKTPGSGRNLDEKANDSAAGVFETRFPVVAGGEHRIRVKDPITGETSEHAFQVTNLSVERRSAVRNVALEQDIVSESRGKRFDLQSVSLLPDEITLDPRKEITTKNIPLASTWLCFGLLVTLMLGEWLTRKLINLP